MNFEDSETRSKRTWFGVTARIMIGPGFIHKSGVGDFIIPHPPMANWLLRAGLPPRLSRDLCFTHEFAHFQTAPLLAVYVMAVFTFAYAQSRIGILEILLLLAGAHAIWEIMSEGFTILGNPGSYFSSYKGVSKIPMILFWSAGSMLTAAGWFFVFG